MFAFSVVIPAYCCSDSLPELHRRLTATFNRMAVKNYEIIMVNDDSPENDWQVISDLARKDKKVVGIDLSRNFGQHYAITAGLHHSRGDWVIVMDGDLQDQPEEIPKMYQKCLEGFEVILGRRYLRKDSLLKKLGSRFFSMLYSYLLETKTDYAVANFGIYHRMVIDAVLGFTEMDRAFPAIVNWLGFKTVAVDIEHAERSFGKSSYTLKKLIQFAFDVIVSQSNKPLKMSIKLGLTMALASFLTILYLLYKYFVLHISVDGWTSIMASMYLLGGLLFANLGILGLYLGKTFNETKKRPLFVVREVLNKE